MSWDACICSWAVTSEGALKPALPEAQQEIVDLLESEDRNWTTAEIAAAIGLKEYQASRNATVLLGKGLIEKPFYGQWRAKKTVCSLHSLREMQTANFPDGVQPAAAASKSLVENGEMKKGRLGCLTEPENNESQNESHKIMGLRLRQTGQTDESHTAIYNIAVSETHSVPETHSVREEKPPGTAPPVSSPEPEEEYELW